MGRGRRSMRHYGEGEEKHEALWGGGGEAIG